LDPEFAGSNRRLGIPKPRSGHPTLKIYLYLKYQQKGFRVKRRVDSKSFLEFGRIPPPGKTQAM
jgi:hypothetical protein